MLTDTKIKQLKPKDKDYRIADQRGLCLEVRTTGAKIWRYRYRFLDKPKMYTIGAYPEVSLAFARQEALKCRELLVKGTDPQQQKRVDKIEAVKALNESFEYISKEMLNKKKGNKSQEWYKKRVDYFERDIYPVIGSKSPKDIDSQDIILLLDRVMQRVKNNGTGTGEYAAKVVKGIISEVMQYSIITKRANIDPTYALREYIEYPAHEHARPMDTHELASIMPKINAYTGTQNIKNATKVLLYTMLRSVEVRRGLKEYIDFENETWTIPVASKKELKAGMRNMKKNRTHIVPLSKQVIAILREQFEAFPNSLYIFPGRHNQNRMIGTSTINKTLKALGFVELSAHDFRATSSTELNEANFKSDWIELQLAHASGDQTRATYNHAKYMKDRREMLQWWADYIDSWGKK